MLYQQPMNTGILHFLQYKFEDLISPSLMDKYMFFCFGVFLEVHYLFSFSSLFFPLLYDLNRPFTQCCAIIIYQIL